MTVKRHFPSLQTCVALKEMGFPQETVFSLYKDKRDFRAVLAADKGYPEEDYICAYPMASEIVDELLKDGAINILIAHEQECSVSSVTAHSISEALALAWLNNRSSRTRTQTQSPQT